MLTRKQVLSGEYNEFIHGQRMAILPTHSPLADSESDDNGGILYFKDGSCTAWYRNWRRASTPNWSRWRR